jgi:hypothetical protein
MALNWTGKLRKAEREHRARILCSVEPYVGEPVVYLPRYEFDRTPWVLSRFANAESSGNEYRYTGKDCHPVYPNTERSV